MKNKHFMRNSCKSGEETLTPDEPLITPDSILDRLEEIPKVKRGERRAFDRDTSIRFDICGIRNVMSINSGSKGHSAAGNRRIKVHIKSSESERKVMSITGRK